ncbi:hypothetical protein Syn8016DRAFT_1764 [Synechococcus sp. WH 8016]|nr:hypothetical protein Syn8016DRAFT_1764 [Synechococcus sp. WH 8016]
MSIKKIMSNFLTKYLKFPPKTKRQQSTYIFLLLIGLSIPYKSSPGGLFTVTAEGKQNLQAPFNGEIVKTINEKEFNDKIKKGTLIATVSSDQIETKLYEIEEQIQAQESKILTLQAQIQVDTKQLLQYQDLYSNSSEKYKREYSLYKSGSVSLNKIGDTERQMNIDKNNINTQKSVIAKSEQQVKTAEYEFAQLKEKQRYYSNLLSKSDILMPFDGYIYSQNLSSRIGSQVNAGDNIANASKIRQYFGLMQISENTAGVIKINKEVDIRLSSDPLKTLSGRVVQINQAAVANESKGQTSKNIDSGNNVKIVKDTTGKILEVKVKIIDSQGVRLVPGLTGWGKVSGGYVPLFWAFAKSLFRFVQIEVWSWFP